MDEHHYKPMDVWDNGVYFTGKTQPPKENSGITALLMIMVIFLSGLVSVLSFMNVRLFQQLKQEQLKKIPQTIAFAEEGGLLQEDYDMSAYTEGDALYIPGFRVWVYEVTEFDRNYFHWPEGLMIVEAESNPYGLQKGDIILRANGEPIAGPKVLYAMVTGKNPVEFTVLRDRESYILNYSPGKAD